MTSEYVVGQGYMIRDARRRILARGLTTAQRDAIMAHSQATVIPQWLLDSFN